MQPELDDRLASKKRKHHRSDRDVVEEPAQKKPKRDRNRAKHSADEQRAEFRTVDAQTLISIPPTYAFEPLKCAAEMLDSMLMRYIPALQGVMLSHSNIHFLEQKASFVGACPFAVCTVAFRALVWGPSIGMRLKGKISLCSPDHISLLVHKTFNVSIPRHHIPTDDYDFEWGQAANDPLVAEGQDGDADAPAVIDDDDTVLDMSKSDRWVHRITGELIGSESGHLEFTVIGLKLANDMLSLVASIQLDPFSPAHIPLAALEEQAQAQTMELDVPPEPSKKKKKRRKDADTAQDVHADGEEGEDEQPKKRRKKKSTTDS
ncbi:hypothetical protein BKA62DRAFT_15551 [Auriculariales sp. MPI-PUGE-AT-0066]|nr:hypothetical protein BKA62DRAFT_15551 [Auriculariales sp. MPI-PUGE-AT-0066]